MDLKENLRHRIALLASLIEILLSFLVLIAVVLTGWRLLAEMLHLAQSPTATEEFSKFLGHAFNVIIGIEFIKMLAKHTPGATIEVLLFSMSRQMVVEHSTPLENLISIITIALVFIIRKFLFVPSFGEHVSYHTETHEPLSAFESDKEPPEQTPPSMLMLLLEASRKYHATKEQEAEKGLAEASRTEKDTTSHSG